MKRFKSILCALSITIALSSAALAGDISTGKSQSGDISTGKSQAGDISTGRSLGGDISTGNSTSAYVDIAGYLLMILSAVTL